MSESKHFKNTEDWTPGVVVGKVVFCVIIAAVMALLGSLLVNVTHTTSRIDRTPLENENLYEGYPFIESNVADFFEDEAVVEEGMQIFFDKLGVRPYLVVNEGAALCGEADYDAFFGGDECGLLAEFVYNGKKSEFIFIPGAEAAKVFDAEAETIFNAYLSRYASSAFTNSELFSRLFSDTALSMLHEISPVKAFLTLGFSELVLIAVLVIIIRRNPDFTKKNKNGTGEAECGGNDAPEALAAAETEKNAKEKDARPEWEAFD